MRETPTIDILVVSYNNQDTIVPAIESVATQANVTSTFYLQDNGSDDETVRVANQALARTSLKYTITQDRGNPGFASAVNSLMRLGQGDFILLLNPDTAAMPDSAIDTFESLSILASDPSTGFVSPKLLVNDGTIDPACCRREPTLARSFATLIAKRHPALRPLGRFGYNITSIPSNSPTTTDALNGAFMMIEREKADLLGPMDERFWMYAEDLDWCRRSREAGFQNVIQGQLVWRHSKAGSEGGKRGPRTSQAMRDSTVAYFNKYHNRWWHRPGRVLVSLGTRATVS